MVRLLDKARTRCAPVPMHRRGKLKTADRELAIHSLPPHTFTCPTCDGSAKLEVSGQTKVSRSLGLPVDAVMSGWLLPETKSVQAKDGAVRQLTQHAFSVLSFAW